MGGLATSPSPSVATSAATAFTIAAGDEFEAIRWCNAQLLSQERGDRCSRVPHPGLQRGAQPESATAR